MSGILSEGVPGAACGIPRGCGRRTVGSLYVEAGLDGDGMPLEDFLMDPPVPVDPAALGLAPRGMRMVHDADGTAHLLDWVGQEGYEGVADFLEEVRRFGLSRKISPRMELARLTPRSRIILVHARAYIANAHLYHDPPDGTHFGGCPAERPDHRPGAGLEGVPCCCGVYADDVSDGVPVGADPRLVRRSTPWGGYLGRLAPEGVAPDYRPAIFARFPVGRFAVVRDPDGHRHEEILAALEVAGHGGVLVEE